MDKLDEMIIKCEIKLSQLLIVAMVVVVFLNAVLRLFNRPLNWSSDVAQLIFIWLSFFGADMALKKGGHAGVDLITRKLPANVNRLLQAGMYVLFIAYLVVIGYNAAKLGILNASRKFNTMPFSYSSVTFAVPVGCLLLAFTSARKLQMVLGRRDDFYTEKLPDDSADSGEVVG